MGFVQAFRMAIKSILSNKVRAFLTMLGVIIGVGAVIAAVAFAKGSTKSITDQIQGMGTNLVTISIRGRGSNRHVTYDQMKKFAQDTKNEIASLCPQITGSSTVKAGTKSRSTSIVGTDEDFEAVRNVHVQSGRFLMSFDSKYRQKVALLGTAVVNDLFKGGSPLNQKIKINGQIFTVIGVLEQTANAQTGSDDDRVIIPITVAQRLTKTTTISNFSAKTSTPEAVSRVITRITTYLTGIYGNADSFSVMSSEQALSTLGNVTGILMAVLGGIATISLVVGGIGIMNIMLVSVTERTREIGIRKAIGAKRRNILIQFLIEAIVVTGMGGLMGVGLGVLIIRFVIGGLNIVPAVYSVPWMLLSMGISLGVGVIFGMFPAYKASKLNPIEALRFE